MSPLLEAEGLTVSFGDDEVVRDVSLHLDAGECLAVVGESGSGKSVTARTMLGLAGSGARVTARRLDFDGTDLRGLSERGWRAVRGRRIGLVLQDALGSLDPLRTVGAEVREAARERRVPPARVHALLSDAGIPDPERRAGQYPHQLSGGLRQRSLIASALAAGPELLIADEPTTALDATVQARVLDLLGALVRDGTALLLISHDLSVVARLADRVAVMYGGRIVEQGPTARVLASPRHPYTRALLAAAPGLHAQGVRLSVPNAGRPAAGPGGCPYAARCALSDDRCRDRLPADIEVRCWYPDRPMPVLAPVPLPRPPSGAPLLTVDSVGKRFGGFEAVRDVSLRLHAGETLGVVGESGSGKTTVARLVLGLQRPDAGTVRFADLPWSELSERRRRPYRRMIQAVPQDPLSSFDPRHGVARILGEAVAAAGVPRGRARADRVAELLDQVQLAGTVRARRPAELSGGQRQRVAIARALASRPRLIVCDEPVSALDVSVQAQILDLLADLRRDLGMALLFISHDLGVVRHVSDRVVVMNAGRVIEHGPVERIFDAPEHPVTRDLVAAAAPVMN
ncbi:dipeptide ABC transporter ATP-binding protein [Catenuloplanes sp. NPDC051500]|uniref:dipeptide ABC transporter ATP-binding protein n=1 Tax=Catenuloplanes sp. NPDC051500 TaxID=3363959 RepID=UPI0037B630C0